MAERSTSEQSTRVATLLLAVIVVLVAWAIVVALTGGVYARLPSLFGTNLRISTRDPFRPAIVAVALMLVYAVVFRSRAVGHLAAAQHAIERACGVLALAISAYVLAVGMQFGSFVAGGSDSYGYVSQAALWRAGDPIIEQPLASRLPWSVADWTLAPLGYRPAAGGPFGAIVPTYPSGLPLLMAAGTMALAVVGLPGCGPFVVVPALGALMVWLTYRLGRRVWSPTAGLAAAALLASSPAFVALLVTPMSDVPVASFFTLAVVCALSDVRTRGHVDVRALATGLAVSLAIVVRPNLAAVAGVFALFLWLRAPAGRARWIAAASFAGGLVPGVAAVALIHTYLYGAPWISGYGSLRGYYAWRFAPINVAHYTQWLLQTQTPFFFAGLLLIPFVAWRRIPSTWRAPIGLLSGVSLAIVFSYLCYTPFEGWEYLRFLLSIFPLMIVLALMACWMMTTRVPSALRVGVLAAVVLLVFRFQIDRVKEYGLLARWQGDAAIVSVAAYVDRTLPRNAVLFSMFHSGSLRHYGRRLTLRYDWLDPAWWPRALDVLKAEGYRPYVVISDWEEPAFRQHGRMPGRLVAEVPNPRVRIYDPLEASETSDAIAANGVAGGATDGATDGARDPAIIPMLTPCPCTSRDGVRPR